MPLNLDKYFDEEKYTVMGVFAIDKGVVEMRVALHPAFRLLSDDIFEKMIIATLREAYEKIKTTPLDDLGLVIGLEDLGP